MLTRNVRVPRLRIKDSNCGLSWFEGDDTFINTTTVGNYPNKGSLGTSTDLNLATGTAFYRTGVPGKFEGAVPLLKPDLGPSGLPHGLSTAETSVGESSSGTLECWVKMDSTANSYFVHKVYNSGVNAWETPFMSVGMGIVSGYMVGWYSENSSAVVALQTSSIANALVVGHWYHFAITWNNGNPVKLYINGILIYTSANATVNWGLHGRWAVGGRGGRGDAYYGLNSEGLYGVIQGVRVHQIERSATWINETYKMGIGAL